MQTFLFDVVGFFGEVFEVFKRDCERHAFFGRFRS